MDPKEFFNASKDTETPLILVVEDNDDLRELMGFAIQQTGKTATLVADVDKALSALVQYPTIRLVVMDLGVPGMICAKDFMSCSRQLRGRQAVKFILASGHPHLAAEAERLHADSILIKPFDTSQLQHSILKTLESCW